MKIYCIRHTKVDVPTGICYGQTDVELAATFEEEKQLILKKIEGIRFDQIYSSPLKRCRKLVEALAPNQQLVFDDRLKEFHFGKWENQCWDNVFNSEEGKEWFADYFNRPCPEGESCRDFLSRVKAFFDELKQTNDQQICIVAHAGSIKVLKALVENQPIEDVFKTFNSEYGEIIVVETKTMG